MKLTQLISLVFIVVFAVSACSMPNNVPTATVEPFATPIQVTLPVPTASLPTVTVPAATAIATQIPANTSTPEPTSASSAGTGACINSAEFVTDISVPDGSVLADNASFVKTWRVKNTGTCTWDSRYSLLFVDGTLLMPVDNAPLPGSVIPGQTIDLSLNMTSPIYPGNYESDWKLRSPSGTLFGVGKSNSPLWIKIVIGSPNTTTITGYVYQDRNGNSVYDQNDILMANRDVWLQEGSCGQTRNRLTSAFSGSDGRYTLSGAFSGTMCVSLMSTIGVDDSFTVSPAVGQTMTNVDLRAIAPSAMISGWVWNDGTQPDGVRGNSEAGIAGAVVLIQRGQCGSPTSVTVSAITDAAGHYQFNDLYSGPHCVSIRTNEGNNGSLFGNGTWSYPVNGIQQLNLISGQEGIANFGWQYK